MKAHIQQENEELALNEKSADPTNDDYDEVVRLPTNNAPKYYSSD